MRVYHDLNISQLSKKIGISASFISELEHEVKVPSLETLQRYAIHFETSCADIFEFSEQLKKIGSKNALVKVRLFLNIFLK